jgi:Large polyvalent protein associated domain 22
MTDYSAAISDYLNDSEDAQSQFGNSVTANPDDAVRAFQLEKLSGIPAETIAGDLDKYDQDIKSQVGSHIVSQNPHLEDFVNSHPLHAQLIHDDLSSLDKLTRLMERLNGKHAAEAGFKAFGEEFKGFGGPTAEFIKEKLPLAGLLSRQAATIIGLPLEAASRTFSGTVGFAQAYLKQAAQDYGMSEQAATKMANDAAGMLEYEMIRPSGHMEVGKPAEAKPEPAVDLGRREFLKGTAAVVGTAATKGAGLGGLLPKVPGLDASGIAIDRLITGLGEQAMPAEHAVRELRQLAEFFKNNDVTVGAQVSSAERPFRDMSSFRGPGGLDRERTVAAYTEAADAIESGWFPHEYVQALRKEILDWKAHAEAGEKIPEGADENFDELHKHEVESGKDLLKETMDAAEQTQLKERSPEKLRELLNQIPESRLRIDLEAVRKLYGEEQPVPGDGKLGYVEGLADKLSDGMPGSVAVSTKDFVAHTPKEIYKALEDDIGLEGALTTNEMKALVEARQAKVAPEAPLDHSADLQAIHQEISEGFKSQGRPEQEANDLGAIVAKSYETRARRLGVSPRQLFEEDGLRIGDLTGEGLKSFFQKIRGVHGTSRDFKRFQRFQETDPGFYGNGVYMFPYKYAKEFGERSSFGIGYGQYRGKDGPRNMLLTLDTEKPFIIEREPLKTGMSRENIHGPFEDLIEHGYDYGTVPETAVQEKGKEWQDKAHDLAVEIAKERGGEYHKYFGEALNKIDEPYEHTQEGRRVIAQRFTDALLKAGYDSVLVRDKGGDFHEMVAIKPGTLRGTFTGRSVLWKDTELGEKKKLIEELKQGERGKISFGDDIVIEAFSSADASTGIHELWHFFSDRLFADAAREDAPNSLANDRDILLKALGRKEGSVLNSLDLTDAEHEQLAKWGEQYLREGKAPSKELAGVFERFKNWLMEIYHTIADLGKQISPEVRGVFDRMLASDEVVREKTRVDQGALDTIRRGAGLDLDITRTFEQPAKPDEPSAPVFQAGKAFGRTQRELKKYERLIAQQDAEDVEWRRARAEKQAKLENSREWQAEADKIRPDIETEVSSSPEVRAYQLLEQGNMKIARSSLTPEQVKELPKSFLDKNGLHIDDVTNFFGYSSSDEFIRVISTMTDAAEGYKGDIVKRLTDAEVFQRVQDKLGESAVERLDEVEDHALSLTQMEKMHELTLVIGQMVGAKLPLSKAAMEWGAREKLLKENFGGMSSKNLLKEVGKAGRAIEKNLLDGDYLEAFRQAQAYHSFGLMAREALAVERETKQFERLAKRVAQGKIDSVQPEYRNWIRNILSRVGYNIDRTPWDHTADLNAAPRGMDFNGWLEDKYNAGYEINVPDFLTVTSFKKDLADMSVMDARQTMAAVKQLYKVGREEQTVITKGERMDLKDWLDKGIQQLSTLGEAVELKSGPRKIGRMFLAATLQIESMLNRWDRGNAFGMFNQFIARPLSEAANYESALNRRISKQYSDLPGKLSKEELNRTVPNTIFKDPHSAEQIDGTMDWDNATSLQLTRKNLRAILLNAGNADNLKRMAKGRGLEPQQVMDWLHDNAKKEDWDWAQAHGDLFAGLKAESDNMRRRLTGEAPESIFISPIQTPFGEYKGWYHPVIHDPLFPGRVEGKGGDIMAKEFTLAAPAEGYTKSRTNYVGPLSLDLDAVPGRFIQEMHDIAFREAVVNANKIISNPRFNRAVIKYYGKEYADLLSPWLKDVANSATNASANQAAWAKYSEFARQNIIITLVGMNIRTIQKHTTTAAINSITEVGANNFLDAFLSLTTRGDFATESNWKFAMEKSEELQRRHQNFREQISGAQEYQLGQEWTFRQTMLKAGTKVVAFMDLLSAVPTWMAAYKSALAEGREAADAIFAGDRAVRRAHGSTAITNRPEIMRGGQTKQWMASLYGFFNHIANRQYELAWQAKETAGLAKAGEIEEAMKNVPHLMLGLFSYVIAPAIVEELVTPYTNSEKESWGVSAAKIMGRGLASSWVGVRDIANALIEGNDPSLGLMNTFPKEFTDLARDLEKKDFGLDRQRAGKTFKHAITALGAATGVANAELGNVAQFLTDLYSGKSQPTSLGDWWRGLTKGKTRQPEDRPDLVERGLRLVGSDRTYRGVRR